MIFLPKMRQKFEYSFNLFVTDGFFEEYVCIRMRPQVRFIYLQFNELYFLFQDHFIMETKQFIPML